MLSIALLTLLGAAQDPKPHAAPAKPQNEFNPTITVFSDALWRIDNKDVVEVEDGEIIAKDDTFLLREVEIDFRAAIDPYADGVVVLAAHQEVPGEYEMDIEEGYVRIKSLPFGPWEEPPLGTRIKVGRFLTAVGRQNRLHTHDLPQPQRGLTYEHFIGEHPFIGNGASAEMFLPLDLQFTFEALQGGGWELAENGTERPQFVGNLAWFTTVADEHDLEVTGIATYGSNDEEGRRQVQLLSLDVLYAWKPARGGEARSLVVAGQVFYGSGEFEEDTDGDDIIDLTGRNRGFGYFAYAQYQLDRRWYVGIRYDWTEYLGDRARDVARITPYLTCYVSEFFRLRVAYEFTSSDVEEDDDLHTFLFQVTAIFGTHPAHPYWANH